MHTFGPLIWLLRGHLPPEGEGKKGFPRGGSWQRRKALTDEGIKVLPAVPSSGRFAVTFPRRGEGKKGFPPWGKLAAPQGAD